MSTSLLNDSFSHGFANCLMLVLGCLITTTISFIYYSLKNAKREEKKYFYQLHYGESLMEIEFNEKDHELDNLIINTSANRNIKSKRSSLDENNCLDDTKSRIPSPKSTNESDTTIRSRRVSFDMKKITQFTLD